MIIQSYAPYRHDRFYDPSDPNKAFIGDPYNWSGVGKYAEWATMVSPSCFLSANHAHPGSWLFFYETNNPYGPVETRRVESGRQIAGTDLWLGKLTEPVGRNIAKYPVLSLPRNEDYDHRVIYTFGLSSAPPSPSNVSLGRNTIDPDSYQLMTDDRGSTGMAFLFDYDNPGGVGADESYLQRGDSGGPSFVIYEDTPALVGIHWLMWQSGGYPVTVGSADTFVPHYVDQIAAAMDGESLIRLPEPVLTWIGPGDGDWDSPGRWSGGPAGSTPDVPTSVIVQNHTVAVTADSGAYSLTVRNRGGVAVYAGNTLEVVTDAGVTNGTLDVRGTLNVRSVELEDATLRIAPGGTLNVDDALAMENTQFTCQVDGAANGRIAAGGEVVLIPYSALDVEAVEQLPTIGYEVRTVISAEAVRGAFTRQPDPGEHLGLGVFHQGIGYADDAVNVTLLQAADGDTNGDGEVGGGDIEAILAAGKFGTGQPADWLDGDFTGDGLVTGGDVEAILATNLFGRGPYVGKFPEEIADEVIQDAFDFRLTSEDLAIDTSDALPDGYLPELYEGAYGGNVLVPEPGTPVTLAVVLCLLLAIRVCRRRFLRTRRRTAWGLSRFSRSENGTGPLRTREIIPVRVVGQQPARVKQ